METVKINLTREKVQKLIDKATLNSETKSFSGIMSENEKKVMQVVESLREKIEFKNVHVGYKRLLAANSGMPKTISTFFIDKGYKIVFDIELKGVKLELTFNEQYNAIELWWMEIEEKNNGKGTEILNMILDVIEELGFKLYLTPVPFDANTRTKGEQHGAFMRLRKWYESFGFERIGKNTPSLIY